MIVFQVQLCFRQPTRSTTKAILRSAKRAADVSLAMSLEEKLTRVWQKVYLAMVSRPTNLASVRVGSFHYICDLYRERRSVRRQA